MQTIASNYRVQVSGDRTLISTLVKHWFDGARAENRRWPMISRSQYPKGNDCAWLSQVTVRTTPRSIRHKTSCRGGIWSRRLNSCGDTGKVETLVRVEITLLQVDFTKALVVTTERVWLSNKPFPVATLTCRRVQGILSARMALGISSCMDF